ncbi:Uncharacterised protein [Mycobacterium tuberculosis]|nr:Uncharacterised protein [Mycobacterium tuberculosis]
MNTWARLSGGAYSTRAARLAVNWMAPAAPVAANTPAARPVVGDTAHNARVPAMMTVAPATARSGDPRSGTAMTTSEPSRVPTPNAVANSAPAGGPPSPRSWATASVRIGIAPSAVAVTEVLTRTRRSGPVVSRRAAFRHAEEPGAPLFVRGVDRSRGRPRRTVAAASAAATIPRRPKSGETVAVAVTTSGPPAAPRPYVRASRPWARRCRW